MPPKKKKGGSKKGKKKKTGDKSKKPREVSKNPAPFQYEGEGEGEVAGGEGFSNNEVEAKKRVAAKREKKGKKGKKVNSEVAKVVESLITQVENMDLQSGRSSGRAVRGAMENLLGHLEVEEKVSINQV